MDSETSSIKLVQGPAGLEQDIYCPTCKYNLRGLTVPRCPECGLQFKWTDLPRLQKEQAENKEQISIIIAFLILLLPCVFFLCMVITEGMWLFIFGLVITFILLVSAMQTGVEIGFASLAIGLPDWRIFRAWWEGVLIGYGVCSSTLVIAGYYLDVFELRVSPISWPNHGSLLVITAIESFIVQCWVVHRRMRYWQQPIPLSRLLLACLLSKVVMAAVWSYLPFSIVRF